MGIIIGGDFKQTGSLKLNGKVISLEDIEKRLNILEQKVSDLEKFTIENKNVE